jgi:hypothetical protein
MTFHVGQKVVRVSGTDYWDDGNYPALGVVYTIRGIVDQKSTGTLLTFVEIRNDHLGYSIEPGFAAMHFRPVKTTDISVFQAMLAPSPKQAVGARA